MLDAGPGVQKPRSPRVHWLFVLSRLCFCPCPRRPWTACRERTRRRAGRKSRLNNHEQLVGSGEQVGRQSRDGGQKKIKVPDTHNGCSRSHASMPLPISSSCFGSGAAESDEEFASLPQSPTPTGTVWRPTTGTCPLHPVGGTGRQQPGKVRFH